MKGKLHMRKDFELFKALPIDRNLLSLEDGEIEYPHFCYPVNAKPIGFEGAILCCSDFMRLVLACEGANPVEQIIWMDKTKFRQHLQEEHKLITQEKKAVLSVLAEKLELAPMENAFEYVKSLQSKFDDSKIQFSDEYYDSLGIERTC
ncbi:MAG: hypothetical protein RRY64_07240 [Oscillospiraceae bacterium]